MTTVAKRSIPGTRQQEAAGTQDGQAPKLQVFTDRHLDKIEPLKRLGEEVLFEMKVVASVLPFRVNNYVIENLIDWDRAPDDPIFALTFPQRDMLDPEMYEQMAELHRREAPKEEITALAWKLRHQLNPHPAGQMEMNLPEVNGETVEGVQHKYRETALFFPSQGQTCHSYCTFCFRWAQFVGDKDLKIASKEAGQLLDYLAERPNLTDLLMTGGDPMVMKTKHLAPYLEGLLDERLEHVQTVRIGTKALSFWPYRFVTDKDADELLGLFERLVESGKHVAVMAHINHYQEMENPIFREAVRRIRATGAEIRTQSPLIKHINDSGEVWARMWREQVRLGMIPYYMFVERDTGAKYRFEVPLAEAHRIYRDAMKKVSGLARTARGPSMSAGPGKVEVQGVAEIFGEKVFVLRFVQGRNPDWVQRPFFAKYDEQATWLNELTPAFGEDKFFFEDEYEAMQADSGLKVIDAAEVEA
ncbi:lysine 2,3-aminomutase [Guyparkeria halophila]|uniref:Lysine 2,3-aminomutase n=1 Tax=Guyparkeria halophila TaxID=47960 RepID=A0ABZ0YVZ6_9GAMM|nr:lysine 2,3-aminomutase [Guyparkeria halophila]WQH16347.1 lysine 2,3-aminomutase [Guyparkeria halophila]